MLVAWMIRTWPHWKAKVNEARKIELDAHGELRGSLFTRIADLERAAIEERRRCDKELRELREKLSGTVRQFIYFQLMTARAIPPSRRTPEIEHMLEQWSGILQAEDEAKAQESE